MTFVAEATNLFYQDGSKASYVACPQGCQITILSTGGTLYYKTTSDVTSGSSDGNLTTGTSASFSAGQYVICATGASTRVFVSQTESVSGNLRVGGNETVVGTTTETGAPTATAAASFTGGISGSGAPGMISCIPIGAVAYGSLGTDAVSSSNKAVYLSEVWLPANKTITGIGCLNGTKADTDKLCYYLFNNGGTKVAQTAAGGTVASGTDAFQEIALTSTYAAVGPARYWIGWQANGTSTKNRTVAASTYVLLGSKVAGTSFGAETSVVAPTTFAAGEAIIGYVY